MRGSERLKTNPDIVFREEDEEAFLFDPDTGSLKCINHLGVLIWRMCDGSSTAADITASITERYPDVSEETVAEDVAKFLQELMEMGYVGHFYAPEGEGQ